MNKFEKFFAAFAAISTASWLTFTLCFIAFSEWFEIDILEFVGITGITFLVSWIIMIFSYLVYEIWISEQVSKFKKLFEPEQSTNIYHEILDEDLEDDLDRWAHYEGKRK